MVGRPTGWAGFIEKMKIELRLEGDEGISQADAGELGRGNSVKALGQSVSGMF